MCDVSVSSTDSDDNILERAKINVMSVLHRIGTMSMRRENDVTTCVDSVMNGRRT